MSAQRYRKTRRFGAPVRPDASNERLSELTFKAGQFAQWADIARLRGNFAEAAAHDRKARQARKALATLSGRIV